MRRMRSAADTIGGFNGFNGLIKSERGKQMATYSAVVESGNHSEDYLRFEERVNCGHKHRSIVTAVACGKYNYHSRYEGGRWMANATWHGWTVHDDQGQRVGEERIAEAEERYEAERMASMG